MKKDYRKRLEKEGLASRTVSFYYESMHAVETILTAGGKNTDPRTIGADDVLYLLDYFMAKDFAMQTRKGYVSSLRKYCVTYGNRRMSDWPRIRLPPDTRPKCDWLTPGQCRTLLSAELTPLQRICIHLELCLGFRHIEVIRLRCDDIDHDEGLIRVRGKGPQGGRPRIVPFTVGTIQAVEGWMAERDELVRRATTRCPISAVIPDELIIWEKAGVLSAYSEEGYGLDKVICLPLSDRFGFHFSNNTLRRTFGRALYRSGVPVPTISKIMGHSTTEMTLRYIGVDIDDMRGALGSYRMGYE